MPPIPTSVPMTLTMNPDLSTPIHWSTVAFFDAARTSPADQDGLGQHMRQCSRLHSPVRALGYGLQAFHRSMSGRFVTSLSFLVALLGAMLLVW